MVFTASASFTSKGVPPKAPEAEESRAYYISGEGLKEIASLGELEKSVSGGDSEENAIPSAEPEGQAGEAQVFRDDWSLILVNKNHLIPEDYEFELTTIKGNIKSDKRVTRHVMKMIRRAADDGVDLFVCSPYRDSERQTMLFNRKVERLMKTGMSEEEAREAASQTVALPGTSEHEVGLAFDFITEDYTCLDVGFEDTEAGKWLKENAADYGFILRYPRGKEDITGIEYEPWHYRYVGERAAREIMDRGITLEEYDTEIGVVDEK